MKNESKKINKSTTKIDEIFRLVYKIRTFMSNLDCGFGLISSPFANLFCNLLNDRAKRTPNSFSQNLFYTKNQKKVKILLQSAYLSAFVLTDSA